MDRRASQLWTDTTMINDPEDLDLENDGLLRRHSSGFGDDSEAYDGRTPLDRTIDRIGMGSYQWTLLSLCGFGWLADNMWLQAVAIILPRIQAHYRVSDAFIGTLSSSMFAGMMIGAIGWGTCSDLMGRSAAFNATLFFTSVFGITASFSSSFTSLCFSLFLLGTAIGGSMPTDGTLLLEHMPKSKQYLVTALSVFFSFGSVLSAFVALIVLPGNSCSNTLSAPCDVEVDNKGWKYMLVALGMITLSMFLARIVFFRLHESPRYLVHAGRPQEALRSLQEISKFNGTNILIELEDVRDHPLVVPRTQSPTQSELTTRPRADSTTIFDANAYVPSSLNGPPTRHSPANSNGSVENGNIVTQYASTGETPSVDALSGDGMSGLSSAARKEASSSDSTTSPPENAEGRPTPRPRPSLTPSHSRRNTRSSSFYDTRSQKLLHKWIRRPLAAWRERVMMVLEPEWLRTTVIVWGVWGAMSLAFTMFNVYLPKLLETRGRTGGEERGLEESLWDVVIFTLGGTPGALLGAYLVESSLGRKWSLAASTFVTALCCLAFAMVEERWAVRVSTVSVGLSATTMWAVLYGWTPEIFGTKVRGTACGIASALSRIGGMIAPILGGILIGIDNALPVYASVVVFVVAGVGVVGVREGGRSKGRGK
ncbi:major facilitator superfamily domain-containing protein [Panaeolus papilionaceus]|nr:major facilitator superfamily domain-containing protein [Panaeolus papilionaceus]